MGELIFDDHPTLHVIMRATADCKVIVVRMQVVKEKPLPSYPEIIYTLGLHDIDEEYLSSVLVFFDSGNDKRFFKRYVTEWYKTAKVSSDDVWMALDEEDDDKEYEEDDEENPNGE